MVTHYPHSVASDRGGMQTISDDVFVAGFGGRMLDRMRQMMCGLHGHDTLLNFEHERMSLRCVSCGHETPGWELNETPPRVTLRGDARRHMLPRHQLINERKIA